MMKVGLDTDFEANARGVRTGWQWGGGQKAGESLESGYGKEDDASCL